jgi:hypothetical protein
VTWAKFGAEYFDQCAEAGLTSDAFRVHTEAIGWLYRINRDNVKDLSIPDRSIRKFANVDEYDAAVAQLVRVGFWRDEGTHFVLVHHADVVKSSLVAQRAKLDRDRKAQQNRRARPNLKPGEGVSADVSADVVAGVSGDADSQSASTSTTGKSESRSNPYTDVEGKSPSLDEKPLGQPDWPEAAKPGSGLPLRFPGLERVGRENEEARRRQDAADVTP